MNKKKIFGSVTILAIATIASLNVQMNAKEENQLVEFGIANVEALATPEALPTGLTGGYERQLKNIETNSTVSYGGSVSNNGGSVSGNVTTHYKTIICCTPSSIYNACDWDHSDSECTRY